jgi:hypothetical protein
MALIALMVLLTTTGAYAIKKAQDAADQAHRTICTVLDGYEKQYHDTKVYIAKHPNGAPALDLSRADLVRSQILLKKRIDSFGDSGC